MSCWEAFYFVLSFASFLQFGFLFTCHLVSLKNQKHHSRWHYMNEDGLIHVDWGGQQRTKDIAVKRKWKVSAFVIKPIYSGIFERNSKALSEALVLYIMLHFVHMWLVWKEASKYTLPLSELSVFFIAFTWEKKHRNDGRLYPIWSFIMNPLYNVNLFEMPTPALAVSGNLDIVQIVWTWNK